MTADNGTVDPRALADQLWTAWETATPVRSPSSLGVRLSGASATTIASELQRRMLASGAELVGTKIGAGSVEVQTKLGTNSPFVSQITSCTIFSDGELVQRGRFIAPLLEAEITLIASPKGQLFAPSTEIADCRFQGWDIDIHEAIADFGLHAALIVGTPVQVHESDLWEELRVRVFRNGELVANGVGSCRGAMLAAAQAGWDASNEDPGTICATGAIPIPVALTPGLWQLEFGVLGSIHFRVDT